MEVTARKEKERNRKEKEKEKRKKGNEKKRKEKKKKKKKEEEKEGHFYERLIDKDLRKADSPCGVFKLAKSLFSVRSSTIFSLDSGVWDVIKFRKYDSSSDELAPAINMKMISQMHIKERKTRFILQSTV